MKNGHVEFRGLRLLKKSGVTRQELLGWIQGFLADVEFGTLHIEFLNVPFLQADREVSSIGGRYIIGRNTVQVALGWITCLEDLQDTVIHELDHFLWDLQGIPWDWDSPYESRRHEIRARRSAERFVREWRQR